MATILKRTIFLEADRRTEQVYYRPYDWAMVTTTLGPMVEPFTPFARHAVNINFDNYNATDEICMVNEIQLVDLDKADFLLSGGVHHLHGGNLLPRTGR